MRVFGDAQNAHLAGSPAGNCFWELPLTRAPSGRKAQKIGGDFSPPIASGRRFQDFPECAFWASPKTRILCLKLASLPENCSISLIPLRFCCRPCLVLLPCTSRLPRRCRSCCRLPIGLACRLPSHRPSSRRLP